MYESIGSLSWSNSSKKEPSIMMLLSYHSDDKGVFDYSMNEPQLLSEKSQSEFSSWEGLKDYKDQLEEEVQEKATISSIPKVDKNNNGFIRIGKESKKTQFNISTTTNADIPEMNIPSVKFNIGFFNSIKLTEFTKSTKQTIQNTLYDNPDDIKHCNCKHSKCMKYYCICFANGRLCQNCNCKHCYNNIQHQDNIEKYRSHKKSSIEFKGCRCSTGCIKGYCRCIKQKKTCGVDCICKKCANMMNNLT